MARKPKEKAVETDVAEAPKAFEPCRQCGNTGDCTRAGKCLKGFK